MIQVSSRSFTLAMLCSLIALGSASESFAVPNIINWEQLFTPTWRKGAALLTIAAVGRLVTKDLSDMSDAALQEDIKILRSRKPLTRGWFDQLWLIFDSYLIGYPGKGKGFKIAGSTVSFSGQKELLGSYIDENDLEMKMYAYKRVPASGMLGITWAYLKPIVSALKFIKDIDDVGEYVGVFDQRMFKAQK